MPVEKRVFVGNLRKNTSECIEQLYDRFAQFGRCIEPHFECHPTFAYLTMEFDDEQQYQKLKRSFNNVMYMGNMLRVDVAKKPWQQRWEEDRNDLLTEQRKQQELLKRQWEHHKKLENIRRSWVDRKELLAGRERKTPRKKLHLKSITFRVNVNGNLKIYKCYKNKLWGYERNKALRDLVNRFTNGYWRDGSGHVVDRLDYSRTRKPLRFENQKGDSVTVETGADEVPDEEQEGFQEEQTKNLNVLENILGSFDFDKPIGLEEDNEYAGANYEIEALYSDTQGGALHAPDALDSKDDPSVERDAEVESEEEFIPKFVQEEQPAATQGTISNTETLRGLFEGQSQEESAFKLIEVSDDDINYDVDVAVADAVEAPAAAEQVQVLPTELPKGRQLGLFFPHFESPFLVAQTQLNKIRTPAEASNRFAGWEDMFWENRAVWTREQKLRHREALRQSRKRNQKLSRKNLI
ncbi:AGR397Cp [Eremothecium gossypii ATCC 10895]|uniref:AGR397Cp n=1 Tax=Eremothecium gossypii (strain ATCC 10895 / CBS 109.51 / FGSC 9923 / NRRL Y-1056) TaxID=284811 RepID=Q74Z10_EREGS|nr:AGR397Cp [Eremothecium gossypii ATCC 10895]AAS54887.2 AGR397Cp [Eremothecium gossypii ATCC 10895]